MEKNMQGGEALAKMKELIESVGITMYCTMDPTSDMASRPMGTAGVDDDGTIWFFTDDHTTAGEEAAQQKHVCLNYSHPPKNTYICVMGDSYLVHDKAKMREMWNDLYKIWFPKGLETPGIALIRVTPATAHYWDADTSRLSLLYSYLKLKVTGEPAKGAEGDMGKLEL